ncbi:MAG: hypothetical protein SFY95_00715 [Planctomycetota bacterium]|nr:hypothetical protein [Planctomycetota bacterium]
MPEMTPLTLLVLAVGGVGAAVVVLMMLRSARAAMLVLGAMVFLSALGVPKDQLGRFYSTWLLPLQTYRSELFMALGGMLVLGVAGHFGKVTVRNIPGQALVFVAIGTYAALMRIFHEGIESGLQSLLFVGLTVVPMLIIIPALLRTWDDLLFALRGLVIAGVMWTGATAIQFALNRSFVIMGGENRFTGLTGNPQHAATYLAPMAIAAVWLVLNDTLRKHRWFFIVAAGFFVLMLAWSGSRTGALMFVVGLTAVLYARLGRAVFILPVLGGAVYGLVQGAIALGIDLGLERLVSTTNTRDIVFKTLLADGLSSPLLGVGIKETRGSENSYLLAFAAYGVGMVLMVVLLMFVSLIICIKVFSARSQLEGWRKYLCDLVLGFNAMFFIGAFFEGYIMARVAPQVIYIMLFSAIASRMIELVQEESWRDQYAAVDDEPPTLYADYTDPGVTDPRTSAQG